MAKSDFNWSNNLGKGTQPVSVLQHNIVYYLESVTPDFVKEVQKLVDEMGLKKGFSFNCGPIPIVSNGRTLAASVDKDNHIELHETFLSYLWIVSYALIVIYKEANAKPTRGLIGNELLVKQAWRLLRYGVKLRHVYRPWKINSVPNPEKYNSSERGYIEQANGVFCFAVCFVLLHEIGHVQLGHTKTLGTYVPTWEEVDQEIAADKWAVAKIREGLGDHMDSTKSYGVIAGVSALMLLSKSLFHDTHPDSDDRLRDAVLSLAGTEKSSLWMMGLIAVRIWEEVYDQPVSWPTDAVPPKEYFLKTMKALSQKKLNGA